MKNTLILCLLISIQAFPQFSVKHEEIAGGNYVVTFRNDGSPYTRLLRSGALQTGTNEAAEVPSSEIFLALPAGTNSEIRFSVIRQSESERDIASLKNVSDKSKAFTNKGFLWIDGSYCAHLSIVPVYSDPANGEIVELHEFRLSVPLNGTFHPVNANNDRTLSPVVDNRLYGPQWKTGASRYAIAATDAWINYNYDYLKFGIGQDGIYRLYRSDLAAYGVPVQSLDPHLLKVFLKGKEVPVYVFGENDNVFNEGDYIEFAGLRNYGDPDYRQPAPFGTSYREYLNKYSDTAVYWLSWQGNAGKRIDTVSNIPASPADTLRYYDELIHSEKNVYWDFSLHPNNQTAELRKNDPALLENETWNEGNLGVGKISIPFSLSHVVPNRPARAFAKLQDYASSISTNAHNLALSINNTSTRYDSGFINKYQVKVLKAEFSSSQLANGNNTIDIHSFATASTINTVIRDWYELEYPRELRAVSDSIHFAYSSLSGETSAVVAVTGLTSVPVSLYKFSPVDSLFSKVTGYWRRNDTLYFHDTVSNGTRYFLQSDEKIKRPVIQYVKKFVNLRSSQNSAAYIAVTHPELLGAVTNYAAFISSSYAVTAKAVSTSDIYDEFNYGFFSPEPIKEFLKSASQNWQAPKPKYVTLIGKGTYDFYGNKTRYFGAPAVRNFVPPYGNPVSDIWFVQWDSTGSLVPQMNIGRIPVKSLDEFQGYVLKHQKYAVQGFDEWNKRYLFFAGGNFTDPNQIAQSKGVNEFIINNFVTPPPIGGSAANFYKTTDPVTNFGPYSPEYIKESIDQGGVFISYIGHSGTQTWDNSITDISQLSNSRDRSPMISDFGCSTAKFAESDVTSFSELAVTSLQGQAISYVGNSSLGYTSTAFSFPQLFYKKLLVDTSASLGDVHRLAKIDYIKQFGNSGTYGLFLKTNTLIGDPIVSLPIPAKPNITVTGASFRQSPEIPTDRDDSATVTLHYFNMGKVLPDSLTIRMTSQYNGNVVFEKFVKRAIPLFSDSVVFSLAVRDRPGEHVLSVEFDYGNALSEIYENDNDFQRTMLVVTTSIRTLALSATLQQTDGAIAFLTPSAKLAYTEFLVDIGLDEHFTQKSTVQVPFDTFFTLITLDSSLTGKRIWVRSMFPDGTGEALTHSYRYGNRSNFLISDSLSFSSVKTEGSVKKEGSIILDSIRTQLSVISAGLNDGSTAVILKDGQNQIPQSELGGHHVCIFDGQTLGLKYYGRYLVSSGGSVITNYETLLDTVSAADIVAIGIGNDGGSNLSAGLKTKIKSLGSIYIDSVKTWTSWAIIGHKGAPPGSVPEKFSKPFNGRVQIDTTILRSESAGTFNTPAFGPVAAWNSLEVEYTEPKPGGISLSILGVKPDGSSDTVKQLNVAATQIDLSDVDAATYPLIRIGGVVRRDSGEESPVISSIGVNYDGKAECGVNYQTVQCYRLGANNSKIGIQPGDSVSQGETVEINFRVYNAGGVPVRNSSVQVQAIWDNNAAEAIASVAVDSIGVRSYKEFILRYNTALGYGRRNIRIVVDPDSVVDELFEDNNIFIFPLMVTKSQGSPLLPNLTVYQTGIVSLGGSITNEQDSALFRIIYSNTGTLANDSITVGIRHYYQNSLSAERFIRRKYPTSNDTIVVPVPILKRSGEHSLQVDLDVSGLITESNESDNSAALLFTVVTTDFRIVQPTPYTVTLFDRMILLNPTSIEPSLSRTALLEIDSLMDFSTKQSLQSPMTEYTTEFPLSSLQKGKRYFWRVKQLNSQRDWTTGSFYQGDTLLYLFGQFDSLTWSANTFTQTRFDNTNGARIVNTVFSLKAHSAGFNDGLTGSVEVNGVNILAPILGPGHNISILDSASFSLRSQRRFNIAGDSAAVDSMIQFVSSASSGDFVVDVVVDDGANNLTTAGRNVFKTIGSVLIDSVAYRDSWAIIGRKGAIPGSVPEKWMKQGMGGATVTSTVSRQEKEGHIITGTITSFSHPTELHLSASIPEASRLTAKVIGISSEQSDTVITAENDTTISLGALSSKRYTALRILFELQANSSFASPSIRGWFISAAQPAELATSAAGATISAAEVMEGEKIDFSATVVNVSSVSADSIPIRISTIQSGLATVVKEETILSLPAKDSVKTKFTFDSRGKKGNLAFSMEIDPLATMSELTRENNSVTIPFMVGSDTLKPVITLLIDGKAVVNGDYISRQPQVIISYNDNNPSTLIPADTTNFRIRLNNYHIPFTPGIAELRNITEPGKAEIRWTPELPEGENFIEIVAKDVTGNFSDTLTYFVNVASQFKLMDLYNIPNPFSRSTRFTFNLAGPITPEEVIIKIYTVAGRLIQELRTPATIGFNSIDWDGRDRDGDQLGNGVYLYRLTVRHQEKQTTGTSKLVKMK